MLLSATSISKQPREGFDFFPLTVDVEERSYAAGKIPGSFFRREGRPSTEAILVCRLIDRPLRPSFADGVRNEVQIVITVLSIAPDEFYDALAINAASASTQISGIKFSGPIGGVRIALIDGQWVAFPKFSQLSEAVFDLTVAGRVLESGEVAIMMVEAEATRVLVGAHQGRRDQAGRGDRRAGSRGVEAVHQGPRRGAGEPRRAVGEEIIDYPLFPEYTDELFAFVKDFAYDELKRVYQIAGKVERQHADDALKARVKAAVAEAVAAGTLPAESNAQASGAFKSVTKKVVRTRILTEGIRIDGRTAKQIRALDAEVQVVPRVHGSAIFQRGEDADPRRHDAEHAEDGAGDRLAEPDQEEALPAPLQHAAVLDRRDRPRRHAEASRDRARLPRRARARAGAAEPRGVPLRDPSGLRGDQLERLDLDGSVCASTLSLLNAGVPLRAHVAGIAMGLVTDVIDGEWKYATLTDILGAEDALGDMDFKVAGTSEYVTALQLDTKLDGIPSDVLAGALKQAKEARTEILGVLTAAIDGPDEMAPTAPRVISVQIPVDKIGELIGPKGKTINGIQDETGAQISIEEDGTVYIGATDGASAEAARAAVNAIANPSNPEVGERFSAPS